MTTIISWAGIDSRGPASIYIASDSRYSYDQNANIVNDSGKKLFTTQNSAEIFGYCGYVNISIQVLDKLCHQIDDLGILSGINNFEDKIQKILIALERLIHNYPHQAKQDLEILYASRIGEGMSSTFHLAELKYDSKRNSITHVTNQLPEKSKLIVKNGSGAKVIKKFYSILGEKSDIQSTSRSVFSSFCDSIESCEDKFTGGAPQLVGIYRTGAPKNFGIIWNNKNYYSGDLVDFENENVEIEWRNNNFERCNPLTKQLMTGAQPQPRPLKN